MTNFIVIKTIMINFSQKIPDNLYNPVADPGFPVGGVDSRGGYVSKILYVKTKESGPLGGRTPGTPPSRSANAV